MVTPDTPSQEGHETTVETNNLGSDTQDVIPEHIDKMLRMYPEYKKLYIDNKNGVYSDETPNAKLYQNPYYKQ